MLDYARWFKWAVFVGILQDWFFALPGIFAPSAVLEIAGADPATQPIWVVFACVLLMILSFLYIPGALEPRRQAPLAFFTVVARLGGVILFFIVYPGRFPVLFGYIDLTLAALQGFFLFMTFLQGPTAEPA